MTVYVWFYRSRETRDMTATDIGDILKVSRTHNAAHGITGMLIYYEGRFTQVIEGAKVDILELKQRILDDSRHTKIVTLFEGTQSSRIFAHWSMAYHDPDRDQYQDLEATLPLDWARRTLRSVDIYSNAEGAFQKMAGWIEQRG